MAAHPVQRKVRTTNSDPPFPRYPNLMHGRQATYPDEIWVAEFESQWRAAPVPLQVAHLLIAALRSSIFSPSLGLD